MKKVILIFIIFNSSHNSLSRILTSDDLGELLIKYANYETTSGEMKAIEKVFEIFKPTWNSEGNINTGIRCFVCRGVFTAFFSQVNASISDSVVIWAANSLCILATGLPSVCRGYIRLNYPILKYIILSTPETKPHTFCALLLQNYQENACPYYDARFDWTIYLPPKVKGRKKTLSAEKINLTIALISDAHVDPLYEPFGTADCNEPTCCRKGQTPKLGHYSSKVYEEIDNVITEINKEVIIDMDKASKLNVNRFKNVISKSTSAGYWGDYRNCDTPVWAYEDTIERIASHKNIDIVYYLGDNIDHHVWETTYEQILQVNKLVIDKMKLHFGKNLLVIPVIGNHESQPTNQFAPPSVQDVDLNTTWLYESLASQWKYYLNDDAVASMRRSGQFSMLVQSGLRVISINNNVAYRFNWWLHFDPLNQKRHLEWLVKELHKAELRGEIVHILTHIPPGDADLTYTWTREYYKVIERYERLIGRLNTILNRFSNTIAAQFAGHTHVDDMKLFISKKTDKAFKVSWGAGSITAYSSFSNSNYKIITLDKAYEPMTIENYIYNLTEANLTPHKRPRWFKLYDLEKIYDLQNLSASSIDSLTYEMVKDKKFLLDLYVFYLSKASDAAPSCDVNCKLEALCKLVTSVLWERKRCEELRKLYFS